MVRRGDTLTDWERVRAMTDEEIEANVDEEDEGVFDWSKVSATSGPPVGRQDAPVEPQVDRDILDWFGRRGPERSGEINDVLRAYIAAEEERRAS
jgi:uncharacterized protein (DUF4415 family)